MSEIPSGGIIEIFPRDEAESQGLKLERMPEFAQTPREPKPEIVKSIGEITLDELETASRRAETGVEGVGTALALFANLEPDQYLNHETFFNINSKVVKSIQRTVDYLSGYEMEMQLALDEATARAWGREDSSTIPISRAVDSFSCREKLPTYEAFHIGHELIENDEQTMVWYTLSDVCQAVKNGAPLQLVHKPTARIFYEFVWEAPPLMASANESPEL